MNTFENNCYRCHNTLTENGTAYYGLHEGCFIEWFGLEKSDNFKNLMAKDAGSDYPADVFSAINSSFFHGKFRKYSADLGRHSYILKVQMADYPELPATEYLCNQIAEALHIKVANFFLIDFNNLPTFVTKNFIDKSKISNLVHIYRYLKPEQATTFRCEALCATIEEKTGRLKEIERFLELCLFDSLIGNNDRHGRNLAIIEAAEKNILSPFYDNPSYLGVEIEMMLDADHNPGGTVGTKTSVAGSSTMKDYVREIERLGHGSVTNAFAKKIDIRKLVALVDQSWLGEKRKKAFITLLKKRYDDLQNA